MIAIALGLLVACASVLAVPYPGAQPGPSYGASPRAANAGPAPGPSADAFYPYLGGFGRGYGGCGCGRGCGCGCGGFVEEVIVEPYYGGYGFGGYGGYY